MKPISNTAFYCCGVRMDDAETPNPVCGDVYAKSFMSEAGLRVYEAFRGETRPNASNVARHRIIDELLRAEVRDDPGKQIVLIGAGFDSRAYRLGGGKWVELDEPQVIAYKEERLPCNLCKNPLQRVPIDFASESLEEKLLPFSTPAPTAVVIEGVFMYLQQDVIRDLLGVLRRVFPAHKLICDLMSRPFFDKYTRTFHEKIVDVGTSFVVMDQPEEVFLANGYRPLQRISIVRRAVELGAIKVGNLPPFLARLGTPDGYSVWVFEPS